MVFQTLTFEREEHVAVVTLSGLVGRTKASCLPDEFADLCLDISYDKGTRVVVLTGTGNNPFCIDEDFLHAMSEGTECGQFLRSSFLDPIANLKQPVVAAINGDAIGQGLELAMACDIRIGTEGARFGLPQIQKGFIPSDGGTQRLPRLVGRGRALELILTGELIDAGEAQRIGLINRVVAPNELMKTATTLAHDMASKSPVAISYVKEALYQGMDLTLDQGLRMELDLYLLLFTTQDRTEGIRAFKEKRAPKFEGA
jgi:enoyl-CoA hydratase/carnithine racemase